MATTNMLLVMWMATAVLSKAYTPPACTKSTPAPADAKNCSLKAPQDPEFAPICHPGALGHAGGAEQPAGRCGLNYTDGVFRCACCGEPLFYASTMFHPAGDGWPAFHGNGSVKINGTDKVCSPGGTEVVCAKCGSHLGDHFDAGTVASYEYYCIDGVCLLPPGAKEGHVCQPTLAPSKGAAWRALYKLRAQARKSSSPIFT